uniref:Transmembrane protein n=1 Tax=Rhizophora mucronata TaxID=61149 RepID=A0A2P2IQJ3_RHIMU
MATAPSPPLRLNLCTLLTESKRIIKAHSRHFLALSVLFLLPLSFSVTVYPTLQNLVNQSAAQNAKVLLSRTTNLIVHQDPSPSGPLITAQSLVLPLLFTIFTSALSLLAVGSITYSVFHGFYGRPVKLVSAIGSAFTSFLPLLVTVVFAQIIVLGILLVSGSLLFLVIKGIELVGVRAEQSSPYLIGIALTVLVLVLIYLQLNWTLLGVVVVVEKRWGLEPLKRSSSLVNGVRKVALSSVLFFGVLAVTLFAGSTFVELGSTNVEWKIWGFVAQIVESSIILTLLFLYNIASSTILYMFCKAVNGELASEIAEEFAGEYVSLPFDDGKVPHVVSVVCT